MADGNSFYYLGQTIKSLANLKQKLFNPCITVFNTKGKKFKEELDYVIERAKLNAHLTVYHKARSWENRVFDNSLLPPKKKHQSNDFYDMIHVMNYKLPYENVPIAIMEDDFVMCEGAHYHIGKIFERISKLENDGKDWVGFRFSFGLNGILIQRKDLGSMTGFLKREYETDIPIDWLLEQYFHQLNHYGRLKFKNRLFYIYRYQIMRHIGVTSSVGNERNVERNNVDFPNCMEPQTQSQLLVLFQVESCQNSYFFPCNDTSTTDLLPKSSMAFGIPYIDDIEYQFSHDTLKLQAFPPSHPISLIELKSVKSVSCNSGDSCITCCTNFNSTCDPKFFIYINRCDELQEHSPDCKCMYERNPVENSVSPLFDGNICVLGSRASRFRCENSQDDKKRLCPCIKN